MPNPPKNFPHYSKELLEPNMHGHEVGKNPLSMDVKLFKEANHRDEPLAKIIRKKCIDCCGFEVAEVRKCVCVDCPLWPFRMGKNPHLAAKRKGKGNLGKN